MVLLKLMLYIVICAQATYCLLETQDAADGWTMLDDGIIMTFEFESSIYLLTEVTYDLDD